MDRGTLEQIRQLLRPIANRVANVAARAVVQLVNDAKKLQLLQVGVLADEDGDDAEHHQPYGFSSVPLAGAEAILVYPNGDRSHPLAITVSDRRHRPTGGEAGEVTMYHHGGARVTMLNNGNLLVRAAPGAEVLVDDGSGSTEPLVKRSEFNAHTHQVATTGSSTAQSGTAAPVATGPGGSGNITGTTVLKAK